MEVYRLEIVDEHATRLLICGAAAVLNAAYDELKRAMEQIDGVGPSLVEIQGMTDSADRAEHKVTIKAGSVVSISLIKLYGDGLET